MGIWYINNQWINYYACCLLVIHSTPWATANPADCIVMAGKQTVEMEIKERLNPVLREIPCVDFSGSCNDMGGRDGNHVWSRNDYLASSTSVPSQ